jgi:hypothetical protein
VWRFRWCQADERGLLKDIERVLGRPLLRAQLPKISEPPVRPGRPAQAEENNDTRPLQHRNGQRQGQGQRQNRHRGNRGGWCASTQRLDPAAIRLAWAEPHVYLRFVFLCP